MAMVVSLQNVLFATDFSSCSEAALPYGIGMCRRYGATLYTVSVVPSEITYDVQPPDPFYLRHMRPGASNVMIPNRPGAVRIVGDH